MRENCLCLEALTPAHTHRGETKATWGNARQLLVRQTYSHNDYSHNDGVKRRGKRSPPPAPGTNIQSGAETWKNLGFPTSPAQKAQACSDHPLPVQGQDRPKPSGNHYLFLVHRTGAQQYKHDFNRSSPRWQRPNITRGKQAQ